VAAEIMKLPKLAAAPTGLNIDKVQHIPSWDGPAYERRCGCKSPKLPVAEWLSVGQLAASRSLARALSFLFHCRQSPAL